MNLTPSPESSYAPSAEPAVPPPPVSYPASTPLAIVDELLATMADEHDSTALDVALDLRLLVATSGDATDLLRTFFRLRSRIERRHYVACQRLCRCFESNYVASVDFDRRGPGQIVGLRLDVSDFDQLSARCVAIALGRQKPPAWHRVRYLPTAIALVAGAA